MRSRHPSRVVASLKPVARVPRGQAPPARAAGLTPEQVRAIRLRLGKTQAEFSLMIGVSLATLRNWEQGRRVPDGPARALLRVAAANPQLIAVALNV